MAATPRPHAELAAKFMSDDRMRAFWWSPSAKDWIGVEEPRFWRAGSDTIWHVGLEAPTEPPPRMVTVAGYTFRAPMTEAPAEGTCYYTEANNNVWEYVWGNDKIDRYLLAAGLIFHDRESAEIALKARNADWLEKVKC